MTGLWVAIAAIAVALAFGAYRTRVDGRFRATSVGRAASASDAPAGRAASASERVETPVPSADSAWTHLSGTTAGTTELGERATLVQFSSAFCAPCRATRRVLGEVAGMVPGVVHVEIDAEQHLEAVRRLGIVRTPTTLVLDAHGRETARAAGAPRKEQVLSAIAHLESRDG